MIKIDPDLLNRYADYGRGTVFEAILPEGSEYAHLCIVVTKKVTPGKDIFYFYMTSQEEKVKIRYRNDPYGYILLADSESAKYHNNIKHTFIQCGKKHLNMISFEDFIRKLTTGEIRLKDHLSQSYIEVMEKAVRKSKTYSPAELKKILD